MRWLTWRQHRIEFGVLGVILALFIPVLILTSRTLEHAYALSGPQALDAQLGELTIPLFLPLSSLPLLLGMFVGAPLVARELEQGTYRLAWTQGVTRERWFFSKIFYVMAMTLILFGALTAILLWWNRLINSSVGPWETFDINGFVLIFYALFGLALGVSLGTLIGKAVLAMALTIPAFIIIRLLLIGLRANYLPAQSVIWDYSGANPVGALDWTVDTQILDEAGNPDRSFRVYEICPVLPVRFSPPAETTLAVPGYECYREHGFSLLLKYQPLDRFWLFQVIESAIFLILTCGLLGLAIWWLKVKWV